MFLFFSITILFFKCFASPGVNNRNDQPVALVNDLTSTLLGLFGKDGRNESSRVKELKEKLIKIDGYVVDKEQYAQLLRNVCRHTNLTETNFYKALNNQDSFRMNNESQSLYLTIKGRMNRDDLLQILSERGKEKVKKFARRALDEKGEPGHISAKSLNAVVDKYLGQVPSDNHTFQQNDSYNMYWDPTIELKELEMNSLLKTRRIYKGERTNIRYYPFMVSVHVMGQAWCGGVLYWYDLVITSAACLQLMYNNRFYREHPKALRVRVGSNYSMISGELIDALEVYFHPAYVPKTLNSNIALIRLRYQVRFSYHRVPKLISLSDNEDGAASNSEVLLLGWGSKVKTQKMPLTPEFLQRKILPVFPKKFCEEVYGKDFVTDRMFCAGTMSTGEGACSHDAGGPAVLSGKLVGIISFGPAVCGFQGAPTVFTLVGAYKDWIETINESIPHYVRGRIRTTMLTHHPYIDWFSTTHATTKTFLTHLPSIRPTLPGEKTDSSDDENMKRMKMYRGAPGKGHGGKPIESKLDNRFEIGATITPQEPTESYKSIEVDQPDVMEPINAEFPEARAEDQENHAAEPPLKNLNMQKIPKQKTKNTKNDPEISFLNYYLDDHNEAIKLPIPKEAADKVNNPFKSFKIPEGGEMSDTIRALDAIGEVDAFKEPEALQAFEVINAANILDHPDAHNVINKKHDADYDKDAQED